MSTMAFGASFASIAEGGWEDDTPNCQRCSVEFTWICRRHHCRKCGQCVCQACSPNKVQVEGLAGLQRVCTACAMSGFTMGRENDTPACSRCSAEFSWTVRRHHCRKCGRCVCDACSPNKVQIDDYSGPQRVCTTCIATPGASRSAIEQLTPEGSFVPHQGSGSSLAIRPSGLLAPDPMETTPRRENEAQSDLGRVHEFLVNFADRLEKLVKPKSSVQRFSVTSASMSDSPRCASPIDIDDAMTRCEQFLSPLAKALKELDDLQYKDKSFGKVSSRLQALSVVAAAMAQTDPPDNITNTDVDAAANCEASLTSLENVLMPQVMRRIENAENLLSLEGVPEPSPERSRSFASLAGEKESWDPNAAECSICDSKLGKRYLNPRHHCRSCARCVCGKCSESLVKMKDQKFRICNTCVTSAFSDCAMNQSFSSHA